MASEEEKATGQALFEELRAADYYAGAVCALGGVLGVLIGARTVTGEACGHTLAIEELIHARIQKTLAEAPESWRDKVRAAAAIAQENGRRLAEKEREAASRGGIVH